MKVQSKGGASPSLGRHLTQHCSPQGTIALPILALASPQVASQMLFLLRARIYSFIACSFLSFIISFYRSHYSPFRQRRTRLTTSSDL